MECNKEEAIRAKGIAEKKMENKDFDGAYKIALKAQKLYPDLENISKLILVCDVHCSAENTALGNERDWYGILGLDPTADESSIKKQFRKFALLLHPDKNKFSGATDAFKLIGEAQRVLLDPEKRMLHDSKRKARFPTANRVPQPASKQAHVGRQPWLYDNFMNNATSQYMNQTCQQPQQPVQPGFNSQATFWTVCPFCSVRYQFYKVVINKLLHCPSCKKSFMGYEMNAQGVTPGTNWSPSTFPQPKEVQNQGPIKVPPQSTSKNFTSNGGSDGNVGSRKPKRASQPNKANDDEMKNPLKRAKFRASFHSTEQEVKDPSPKEEVHRTNNPAGVTADVEEKEVQKANEKVTVSEDFKKSFPDNFVPSTEPNPNTAIEPEILEYPDPDFSDFDRDRKEECFGVGQIWAVYDTLDAMPRFYALIRKVRSPGFKLQITWLESKPDDEDEIKWVDEGLPVSCGKFKLGNSENVEDHPMFSHLVHWEKRSGSKTYDICPRKGETWALFKNWDMKWFSDPDIKKKFEFEYVEVLSDYADDIGVYVSYLCKVKGFACLFSQIMKEGMDSILIPPKERFRFSHKAPSFRMTGLERNDVRKGSFELDPASLPANLEEIAAPENVKTEAKGVNPNGVCSESPPEVVKPMLPRKPMLIAEDNDATPSSTPEASEIPDPEFYNFDADKSPEKFETGQIWALYSDEDGLPKYYGQIKKIDSLPEFQLHVAWFFACLPPKYTIRWVDKTMPVSCGKFKLKKAKCDKYPTTDAFSHQVGAELNGKDDIYAIFPRKGEVWALYKNWTARITSSDLENCEYDFVEVVEENESWTSVLILEKADGFKSVFKAQLERQSAVTVKIPRPELIRFSHQIPSFRLTDERGGSLRGFWELDPAALPSRFFGSP